MRIRCKKDNNLIEIYFIKEYSHSLSSVKWDKEYKKKS